MYIPVDTMAKRFNGRLCERINEEDYNMKININIYLMDKLINHMDQKSMQEVNGQL